MVGKLTPVQSERVASTELDLQKLQQVDTLIRLDNHKLAEEISRHITQQASETPYHFDRLKVVFAKQFIKLEATLSISDTIGNSIVATATGDVLLDFSGNHLEWFPRFDQLQIQSKNFTFENNVFSAPTTALQDRILGQLNEAVFAVLLLHDKNAIALTAVPLGTLEVGLVLSGFGNLESRQSETLKGIFIVKNSATLIERRTTTIALSLEFIPDLSNCPADVSVSRAGFTQNIKNREPIGLVHRIRKPDEVRYYYSEIAGAKRPLTVIHYWFEDGKPLAVKELHVGPSKHWRTWSAKVPGHAGARRWEVLVVEKESGCILHTQSLRQHTTSDALPNADKEPGVQSFSLLREAFIAKLQGYSILVEKPDIALLEVDREFFEKALSTSLHDLQLDVQIDTDKLTEISPSASLQPFDTEAIACDQADCPPAPECTVSLSQCKRLHDNRDCSSCLFRNPLNNRCVSQTSDPLCEATRRRQNIKYEAERSHCINAAETAQKDCEELWIQLKRSCEIESDFEKSSCEAAKNEIASLPGGTLLARTSATARAGGRLAVNFLNFATKDNFSRLKFDLVLNANLQLDGKLNFQPLPGPQILTNCISAWNVPYTSRIIPPLQANTLLSELTAKDHVYTSRWSAYVLPVTISPTPLESAFRMNPHLLADCAIHLTTNDVAHALTGTGSAFYHGHLQLEIQPLPTHIYLAPASIKYTAQTYRADAQITATHLKYNITD